MLLKKAFEKGKILPIKEIRTGTLSPQAFGLEFSAVTSKTPNNYNDPKSFFKKTYFTNNMTSIMKDIIQRTNKKGGLSNHVLDTSFGGGKTHVLTAIYHLFNSPSVAQSNDQIQDIIKKSKIDSMTDTAVVIIDGNNIDAEKQTIWGMIAEWLKLPEAEQLHKKRLPPNRNDIKTLLEKAKKPVVILMDELVVYLRNAKAVIEGGDNLASQTSGFIQKLFGAVQETENCVIVLTISGSESAYSSESEMISKYLSDIVDIVKRTSWISAPIEKKEIAQIVKKQLFDEIDPALAETVSEEMVVYYDKYGDLIDDITKKKITIQAFKDAYPFHPIFLDLLYERISTLDGFQQTRGVLRLLSLVLKSIWETYSILPPHHVISAGTVDLRYHDLLDEVTAKLGLNDYREIIYNDITNIEGTSKAQSLDKEEFGGNAVTIATSIFFYTLISDKIVKEHFKGASKSEIIVQACQPEFSINPNDIPKFISSQMETLWYLYEAGGRLFFDKVPNINRPIVERASIVSTTDLKNKARKLLESLYKGDYFRVQIFESSYDAVKTDKPSLFIFDWDFLTTTGAIPDQVKNLIQRYSKNTFRDEQNLIYSLVPHTAYIEEAKENIKRFIAAEELLGDPIFKKEHERLKLRRDDLQSKSQLGLTVAYTFLIYPSATDPKIITIQIGDSGAKDQQHRIVNALFNAKKFSDTLEGWVIDEEILKGSIMNLEEVYQRFTNNPASIYLMPSPKPGKMDNKGISYLKEIIKKGVDGKSFGLCNALSKETLNNLTKTNLDEYHEKLVDYFFFGMVKENVINEKSLILPKRKSEEIEELLKSYVKVIPPVPIGGGSGSSSGGGSGSSSGGGIPPGVIPPIAPPVTPTPKRSAKEISTIEDLEELSSNYLILSFSLKKFDIENVAFLQSFHNTINPLNFTWRETSLDVKFEIGNKISFGLEDGMFSSLNHVITITRDIINKFPQTDEKIIPNISLSSTTNKEVLFNEQFKKIFSSLIELTENQFLIKVIEKEK